MVQRAEQSEPVLEAGQARIMSHERLPEPPHKLTCKSEVNKLRSGNSDVASRARDPGPGSIKRIDSVSKQHDLSQLKNRGETRHDRYRLPHDGDQSVPCGAYASCIEFMTNYLSTRQDDAGATVTKEQAKKQLSYSDENKTKQR